MKLVLSNDFAGLKKGASFGLRVHTKKPAYFDTSERRREVKIGNKTQTMVLHPKRESSDRVNLQGPKDIWWFIDDASLREAIASQSKAQPSFDLVEGRQPKKEEPK